MLGKTGSPIKVQAMMYNKLVEAVLLYGRKILSMTDTMMTVVGEFQHSIDRRIAGMTARKGKSREW